jgi:hypothetical protein
MSMWLLPEELPHVRESELEVRSSTGCSASPAWRAFAARVRSCT